VLSEDLITAFLGLILALVLVRAAYERRKFRWGRKETEGEEVEPTSNEPVIILSAVFVVVFYLEMALYVVLAVTGVHNVLVGSFVQLRFPFDSSVQAFGFALMVFGYLIVFMSLHDLENDKLVTWGPYRSVRHPQYAGCFIIFAGFFLLLLNPFGLIPLLSIPGEVRMATLEEKFLTRKFRSSYTRYQESTGKFFPKLSRAQKAAFNVED
jgi:protein-S-isoprenylcysteine O-methyltransferase Ste14